MLKKKPLIPVIILFSVCLVAVLGFVVFRDRSEFAPTKTGSTSPAPEPVLNWQTYGNVEYHLRFQYPPDFDIEELSELAPNFLQVNLLKTQKAQAIIMVYGNYEPEDAAFFVGNEPIEEKTIDGQAWYFFNFPQGYSRSRPFTVLQKEGTSLLYSFKFYDLVTDELRDQVMATVRITP